MTLNDYTLIHVANKNETLETLTIKSTSHHPSELLT